MNEELKNKKEEYATLKAEYEEIIGKLKENRIMKRAARKEMLEMRKKLQEESTAKPKQ